MVFTHCSLHQSLLDSAKPGDVLRLVDARGRRRTLAVSAVRGRHSGWAGVEEKGEAHNHKAEKSDVHNDKAESTSSPSPHHPDAHAQKSEGNGRAVVATTDRTLYLVPGSRILLMRALGGGSDAKGKKPKAGGHKAAAAKDRRSSASSRAKAPRRVVAAVALVGALPAAPGALRIGPGDTLTVQRGDAPGRATSPTSALVSVNVPQLFNDIDVGHRVLLDDGRIAGRVVRLDREKGSFDVDVQLAAAAPGKKAGLRGFKGVNIPVRRDRSNRA